MYVYIQYVRCGWIGLRTRIGYIRGEPNLNENAPTPNTCWNRHRRRRFLFFYRLGKKGGERRRKVSFPAPLKFSSNFKEYRRIILRISAGDDKFSLSGNKFCISTYTYARGNQGRIKGGEGRFIALRKILSSVYTNITRSSPRNVVIICTRRYRGSEGSLTYLRYLGQVFNPSRRSCYTIPY